MKVLLIHPHIFSRFNGAPMGLLYLAAALENNGHEVRLLDLQSYGSDMTKSQLTGTLKSFSPHLVGISSTSPSHKNALYLADKVKMVNPDIIVVKGGVHETYCARHTLTCFNQVDYSIAGEGDESFPVFIDALENSRSINDIPGLAFRKNGEVQINPISRIRNLDNLPLPARHILPDRDYYNFAIFNRRKTAQVQTARGCPFICSFCNQSGGIYVKRGITSVLNEIKSIESKGYEALFFDDSTFTVDHRRVSEFMNRLIAEDLSFRMGCQTRAELVSPGLLDLMSRAGFTYISFGLETTDEETFKNMMKSDSVDKHTAHIANAIQYCREAGISSCINLIVGFPNENDETLKREFEFVSRLNPDYVSLSALALYPHEDTSLAEKYSSGVSNDLVWHSYDEGYGAVHPYIESERAQIIIHQARSYFGNKLNLI